MIYTIDRETHQELKELIEDSVEYFCDKNMVSGELTWIIVETLAQAKIAQMRGIVN
jgi:hypothetical protein